MSKRNTQKKLPLFTLILAAVAVGLLGFGTIGGARAALEIFSDEYDARIDMKHIGITLNESNSADGSGAAPVSSRNYEVGSETLDGNWVMTGGELLTGLRAEIEATESKNLVLGKTYNEWLSVTNSSQIDEYVRVSVYKYWQKDGKKDTSLDPSLIDLHFLEGKWVINQDESTNERTVLYYTDVVPVGGTTDPLTDTLKITYPTAAKVTQTTEVVNGVTVYTTTYDYAEVQFVIEAQADGVQTHNAVAAIKSAWGKNVSMNGTSIDPASLSHN